MRTKRDIEILKFVEKHKSITIEQCNRLFYKSNIYGYDQARKRLSLLKKEGFLKRYRKDPRSISVYYIEKPLKLHDLKLLDVYIEIVNKFIITTYGKEFKINLNGKDYIYDAVIGANHMVPFIIEIDYTHYTNINKVRDLIYHFEVMHKKPYIFIIVKYAQMEIEMHRIGDYSFLYILPWNLQGINEIIDNTTLNIDYFKPRDMDKQRC